MDIRWGYRNCIYTLYGSKTNKKYVRKKTLEKSCVCGAYLMGGGGEGGGLYAGFYGMYICIYVYMYICIYVYMYICIWSSDGVYILKHVNMLN